MKYIEQILKEEITKILEQSERKKKFLASKEKFNKIKDPYENLSNVSFDLGWYIDKFGNVIRGMFKTDEIKQLEKVAENEKYNKLLQNYANTLFRMSKIQDENSKLKAISKKMGFYVDKNGKIIAGEYTPEEEKEPTQEVPPEKIPDEEEKNIQQAKRTPEQKQMFKQNSIKYINLLRYMEETLEQVDLPEQLHNMINVLKKSDVEDYLSQVLNVEKEMSINPLSLLTDPMGFLKSIVRELKNKSYENAKKELELEEHQIDLMLEESWNVNDKLHLFSKEPKDYLEKHKKKEKRKFSKERAKEVEKQFAKEEENK